jgi:hypothetical protein
MSSINIYHRHRLLRVESTHLRKLATLKLEVVVFLLSTILVLLRGRCLPLAYSGVKMNRSSFVSVLIHELSSLEIGDNGKRDKKKAYKLKTYQKGVEV